MCASCVFVLCVHTCVVYSAHLQKCVVLCCMCVHSEHMCCVLIIYAGKCVCVVCVCVCVWQFSIFTQILSGSERENVSLSVENTASN